MKQIPFTKAGLDEVKAEYDRLKAERPDAVMHLKKARELGDLSENGYYKASRAKLSHIDSRLLHLKYLIMSAVLIEKSSASHVEIGSTLVVNDGKSERQFSVVGGYESNPTEGKISHVSPLGKALLGAKVGEKRIFQSPQGVKEYTVIKIQ